MCGICGIVNPRGVDSSLLEKMTEIMFHRGPDAGGNWISESRQVGLGNRRLAIIDLDPRSNMPLRFPERGLTITYNGEIYNYRDTRAELEAKGHRFETNSDTEVILHAYDEWDFDAIHKLRGMFAFALWDEPRKRLWVARDRLGIKPVIYYLKDGVFAFASEIQQFSESGAFKLSDDLTALYDSLTYGYIPSPKTAFKELRKLEAGHYLIYENGLLRDQEYWDVREFGTNDLAREKAVELIRESLEEAISLRLVADVPVGTLLSGGIDSSCVTWYAQKLSDHPLFTFSVGFDARSELGDAKIVADSVKSNHVIKHYNVESAKEDFARWMFLYGEPHGDSSIFPTTLVSQMAREKVTVALSGDGGDEVFWGYKRYLHFPEHYDNHGFPFRGAFRNLVHKYYPLLKKGRHRTQLYLLDDFDLWTLLMGGLPKADKEWILDPGLMREFKDYDDYWSWRKYWKPELPLATRLQYLDLKTYLPDDIMVKVDRASMAVSLEAREPLLDHKLVETAFSLSDGLRSDGKTLKLLFKQAMRGVLPDTILSKPKQGFSIPWRRWVKAMPDFAKQQGDGSFFRRGLALPPSYPVLVVQQWLKNR
ncbi:asparagine synthase (glutamine-hydrolyzing) [bacterium]|nr:asparagine synthase (glutamine-hydrolyzing) [bacterium]